MTKLPPNGTHIVMQWVDAAEVSGWHYSADEPKLPPRIITSRGTLVGRTALGVVLSASISEATVEGERGYLSLLAIPYGCILKCSVLA